MANVYVIIKLPLKDDGPEFNMEIKIGRWSIKKFEIDVFSKKLLLLKSVIQFAASESKCVLTIL